VSVPSDVRIHDEQAADAIRRASRRSGAFAVYWLVSLVLASPLALWVNAAVAANGLTFIGVNRPGLPWLTPDAAWRRTVDRIAANGGRGVRMMLVPPFQTSLDVIAYSNQKGVDVLLVVPLTLDVFYQPGMVRRPGNNSLKSIARISQLDTQLFLKHWSETFARLAARNLRLQGVQVANEFNSCDFNGDAPLIKGGAIVSTRTHRNYAFWNHYVAGMGKLVEALRIVKVSLTATPLYKDVPVVLGGLARPSTTWLKSVDASLVEPDLALKTLIDLGADRYIDAYAIHLYPRVPAAEWSSPHVAIARHVEEHMAQVVAVTGGTANKPWWITEWGFKRHQINPGPKGADSRLPLFRAFPQVLAQSRYAPLFGPTFIYDWDESENYRIWDGRSVLGTTDFFPPPARSPARPLPAAPQLPISKAP
jgi:hypothetical protein